MSPVPPAMSRIFHPGWGEEAVEERLDDTVEKPGLRELTKWSFQRR